GRKDRSATFKFDKPVAVAKGGTFTVVLDQQFGTNHTIGRLRLNLGMAKPDDGTVADRRKQAIQDKYKAWLDANAPKAVEWTVVRPADMKSNAPTLRLQPDDSVLANGDITKSDTYELTYRGDFKNVTAVRLEAIPDPSLPKGGPGMVFYEGPPGDFSLSNVALWADGQAGKFAKAAASFAAGGAGADKAIDDNLQTGWMINGGQGKPHVAVFALDKPLTGKELKLALSFEKYYAAALGRFRVSVTTDPRAASDPNPQPPAVDIALRTRGEDRSAEQEGVLFRQFLNAAPELAAARAEVDKVVKSIPEPPTTLVMAERDAEHARVQHLYNRGEFLQPAEVIEPGVPSVLPPLPAGQPRDRLAFAKWLVSPGNPLTARVTVNRQWQAFFGRGIVRTTDDFGYQGDLPTHPELLDWLAVEFVTPADGSPGWSMKRLHKLIVTSSTYRQSSAASPEGLAKDPQNLLVGRAPRFRAEAEIVRDAALRAAGLLSAKMFGPSVFPPQPASVTNEGAYGKLAWTVSTGEDRYRRSLYTFAKRTAPFAAYNTFDAPTGEACVARREVSNTPLQALTLLNDQVFVEAAQALGKLAAAREGDDAAKATFVFRRVLTRAPDKDEAEALVAFVAAQRQRVAAKELDAAKLAGAPAVKDVKDAKAKDAGPSPEAAEQAVWTAAARAVMNLDEAVAKG
ncbi:MAG: hypothetical protein JWO31_496, partial [Phycisphaerales bacterium]|nr:hypothetical protein [Phycisphaerales bacterium]